MQIFLQNIHFINNFVKYVFIILIIILQIAITFGGTNLHHFTKYDEDNLSRYYDMLITFGKHPSLHMFSMQILEWQKALEDTKNPLHQVNDYSQLTFQLKNFRKLCESLLHICSDKMVKELANPENESMNFYFYNFNFFKDMQIFLLINLQFKNLMIKMII